MSLPSHQARLRSSLKNEDYVETLVVIPPDGGWGWVVVFAAFFFQFVSLGTMCTFGSYMQDIVTSLKSTRTEVCLGHAMMTGAFFLLGPLASSLINRFGIRLITIAGGLISAAAILVSTLTSAVPAFLVIYGLFGGFGFCLIQMASIVAVGIYFEKWRTLATSIVVCGAPAGVLAFSSTPTLLLKTWSWQDKFQLAAVLILLVTAMGILYRPLIPQKIITFQERKVVFREHDLSSSSHVITTKPAVTFSFHNLNYPTTAEMQEKSTVVLVDSPSVEKLPTVVDSGTELESTIGSSSSSDSSLKVIKDYKSKPRVSFQMIMPHASLETISSDDVAEVETDLDGPRMKRLKTIWCCYGCFTKKRYFIRPMYKDDILYNRSMSETRDCSKPIIVDLPGQSSKEVKDSSECNLSVTQAASMRDYIEVDRRCNICPESMKQTLATMLDVSILQSCSFVLLALSGFFTMLGLFTPLIYIEERALANGFSRDSSAMLLSCLGGANIVGTILCGVLSSTFQITASTFMCWCLFGAGFSTLLSSQNFNITAQFSYATIYGLTIASFITLKSIIVVEILGIEKLTNALGIMMVFHGVACILGVPISALILEYTHNYSNCFYFAGSSIAFSGLLLTPIQLRMTTS